MLSNLVQPQCRQDDLFVTVLCIADDPDCDPLFPQPSHERLRIRKQRVWCRGAEGRINALEHFLKRLIIVIIASLQQGLSNQITRNMKRAPLVPGKKFHICKTVLP